MRRIQPKGLQCDKLNFGSHRCRRLVPKIRSVSHQNVESSSQWAHLFTSKNIRASNENMKNTESITLVGKRYLYYMSIYVQFHLCIACECVSITSEWWIDCTVAVGHRWRIDFRDLCTAFECTGSHVLYIRNAAKNTAFYVQHIDMRAVVQVTMAVYAHMLSSIWYTIVVVVVTNIHFYPKKKLHTFFHAIAMQTAIAFSFEIFRNICKSGIVGCHL